MCDRHRGIGADGLITIGRGGSGADCTMTLQNADGGVAEMSGNGIRCLAWVAARHGLGSDEQLTVETAAGRRVVTLARAPDGSVVGCRRRHGRGHGSTSTDVSITVHGTEYRGDVADIGNPHFVCLVDDPATVRVTTHGPVIERNEHFQPQRTNVEFVRVDGHDALTMRVWERGAGETLSCGTGACAAAAVAHRRGLVDERVCMRVPGGELDITRRRDRATGRAGRARLRHGCGSGELMAQPRTHTDRQRRRLTATEVDFTRVRQRALLVGTTTDESLDELALLADTAGADVAHRELQRRSAPDPARYIGKGKAEELRGVAEALDVDVVIFDDELTPAQQRNLEKLFSVDVVDRVALILDIFAQHATSQEGALQVELAQLRYRLPRLRGRGTQLSQQGAGIGTRGPGETQLEVDRRRLLRRMQKLDRDLKALAGTRATQRKARKRRDLLQVALVGYTNAGQVDAAQPSDARGRARAGPVVLDARSHSAAPAPARRRDRAPLRHGRVRPPAAAPARGGVPLDARRGAGRRPVAARGRRERARRRRAHRGRRHGVA